jgi:hypothetical protein
MLQVLPPNRETVTSTAKLALEYLQKYKDGDHTSLFYTEEVIKNVIKGLEDPDFGKDHYSDDHDFTAEYTITAT